jgi:serine/threonine protein kinase/formylglycine-generating enzyme required for sulfatase activity/dienelactone hydrolase
VAIKLLPSELSSDEEAKERFIQEAQSAAALSHPNICTIYEVEEADEKTYIAMEYIEGESLREKTVQGPFEIEEAMDIAIQAASGLEEAHRKGIIHRDIKSANIMVDEKGQAKIMDFGLAKVVGTALITKEARIMGTVAYMSPEQARGETVDHRSDIWALGVVLYEILSGQLPFGGDNEASILYSIEHREPLPIRKFNAELPIELERIIQRALQKNQESRYSSSAEMLKDLTAYLTSLRAPEVGITDFKSFLRHIQKPRFALPAVLVILLLCSIAVWFFTRSAKMGWARKEALPEIRRLVEENNYTAAFKLALQAEKYIPKDPLLTELWPKMSMEISIHTTPSEADVYMRDYSAVESDWDYLGQTPIESIRVPQGFFQWKIEKEGYRPVERASSPHWIGSKDCQLNEEGSIPPGMIRVQGGEYSMRLHRIPWTERVQLGDFLIEKYEVTNKQYRGFVESGGYRNQKYWKNKFMKDGQILSWEEAMAEFRDATGRPGPATWELGTYPEGQDDYPVAGISWYEAAAYAEYAGKSLPTVYHWVQVAGLEAATYIVPLSNFEGSAVAPVGSYQSMSPYGTYDMAGNVKEWCWNESEGVRYIMGGAWNEPSYFFYIPLVQSPFDRSASNGLRCMKEISSGETSRNTVESIILTFKDYSKEQPVSDEIFNVYRSLYSYDKTELDSVVESTEKTSPHWKKEKITYEAAYGNERVIAYLFLPKNSNPPYQTVIYFPGGAAWYTRSSEKLLWLEDMDFIVRDGRAFLYPVYKSTYERGDGFRLDTATATSWKEHIIQWVKDFQRSIDYLETRPDINQDKLAYYGLSAGAVLGSFFLALENRIKTAVLDAGGFEPGKPPGEIDQINYVPRVKIPILMLNGRYDYDFPLEESARPMFRLLGTPEEHKHLEVFDSGHYIPSTSRTKWIKATLDWFDRYLGPVK